MEGDKEIAKIIYTDGCYSLFDAMGEEHLYARDGTELPIDDDPEWEDDDEIIDEDDADLAGSMHCLEDSTGFEMEEETPKTSKKQKKPKQFGQQ